MKRPQLIAITVATLLVISLFAATKNYLFGERKINTPITGAGEKDAFTTDSVLYYAKKNLPQSQVARLAQLENSITRGGVADQKLHLMHRLGAYWSDSARAFTPMAWYPYAYYTAEAARLENSEKSLSFAAHLFLEALPGEETHQIKHWEADQAKDLFERSLKLNSANDSAKVGLGATILYGELDAPMTGIGMIREVLAKDSTNTFAQMTLAEASLLSGQLDKATERFRTVVRLQPDNLKASLLLADTYEKMSKKDEAARWYKYSLRFITNPEIEKEVEKRIAQLQTK